MSIDNDAHRAGVGSRCIVLAEVLLQGMQWVVHPLHRNCMAARRISQQIHETLDAVLERYGIAVAVMRGRRAYLIGVKSDKAADTANVDAGEHPNNVQHVFPFALLRSRCVMPLVYLDNIPNMRLYLESNVKAILETAIYTKRHVVQNASRDARVLEGAQDLDFRASLVVLGADTGPWVAATAQVVCSSGDKPLPAFPTNASAAFFATITIVTMLAYSTPMTLFAGITISAMLTNAIAFAFFA